MKVNNNLKKLFCGFNLLFLLGIPYVQIHAQGIWTPLKNKPPYLSGGIMLLLTDGTVIVKTDSVPPGNSSDGNGSYTWSKLTPDIHGSYINGTWSNVASMNYSRLYFSSQVLKDGRVYVAGGEYGNGLSTAEIYDPLTDVWTPLPNPGGAVSDGNSEMLPDGRVLQAMVNGNLQTTKIYDPVTNTYINGPMCLGIHNESAWVKLRDSSILFPDRGNNAPVYTSERYIPSQNKWVADDTLPVHLYDPYGFEMGSAALLPNGKAFFLGSTGCTAIYTPSGDSTPGHWVAGDSLPNKQGTPDAPSAMMVNGKILFVISPVPTAANHFPNPTTFYEFDYLTNSFTQVKVPNGTDTLKDRTADCTFLDLPDGTVLYSNQLSSQYYVYTPGGTPLAAGKPTINNITQSGCTFTITGTLFNGISEGASYGDDWQMSTNRPVIRLSTDSTVYYARTFNWNSTGVQRGTSPDTTQFSVPWLIPSGTYSLVVTANGIASDPFTFNYIYNPCNGPVTALDAGVAAISSPSSSAMCSSVTFTPHLLIRNFGADTLLSCIINYHIDSNPNQTYTWNGLLAYLQSATITLPSMTISTVGTHTFTSATSQPNGGTDDNTSNDQMQTAFINVMSNTASGQAPYAEGFESNGFPYTDCYITSQNGPQWTRVATAASTGSASMELQNFGVMVGDADEFITPAIDMSTVTSPTMTFQLAHAQLNSTDADQLQVFTSTNCGNTWTQRYSKSGATLATAGVAASAFTPSSSQWRLETVNIANAAGQADTRFKFLFTSNGNGNNIYIDDINITGTAGVMEEFENGFDLTVFPNPFSDNTTISFNILEKNVVSISVHDIIGKEVISVAAKSELSAGTYAFPLQRSIFKSGIYFVTLNVGGYSVTKKMIAQ